ncbi:hypothetical protein ACVME8_006634 [Bradyrhizobium diazoefficiens]
MMPASTNGACAEPMISSILSTVSTLTALQSTTTGFFARRTISAARRSASATASPGGTIERMMSASAIASSSAPIMPASAARFCVASLRPFNDVSTRAPFSLRRRATALPMAPGARIAMVFDVVLDIVHSRSNTERCARFNRKTSRRCEAWRDRGHPAGEWPYSTFAGWGWSADALAMRAAFAMPASAAAFFGSGAAPGCTTPADMIRVAASSVLMSTSTILLLGT